MNIEFKNIESVYFLGIGGIGMSALARYFKRMGKEVAGYDKTQTPLTQELENEGVSIHYMEDIQLLPMKFQELADLSKLLIVHTPAVPTDHSEYVYLKNKGVNIIKRAKALGIIAEQFNTIAVAGTHGKTTTSSIVTHLMKSANLDCAAFLGGITKNYNTNILFPNEYVTSPLQKPYMVVEADEYDKSFLTLFPQISVITSMDPDHLDIYGTEQNMVNSYLQFVSQTNKDGVVIVNEKLKHFFTDSNQKVITYGMSGKADVTLVNSAITGIYHTYSVKTPNGVIKDITLGIPGFHNVENSLVAIAVAHLLKISEADIRKGLQSFKGVKRRFDVQFESEEVTYIDDYAHHPEEINAFVKSVKSIFPTKQITGIFQPHLYSRTRDFVDGFAESLSLLDEVVLLDIYPAREQPMEGVTSDWLLSKINCKEKSIVSKNNLIDILRISKPEVLLTIGAGDIDTLVAPIREMLESRSGS
ncbi:MAG: UDP-N-acetylmuramate--L-alanine ligase [Bacteroidetes bacterium]|nr:UDP-N-acetylmuramate--L-alanine ligase [Bacteroidota bacterium]